MLHNVGGIDRVLRVIVGLLLLAYALKLGFTDTGYNWVGWIGVVPLATGLFGTCPAYTLFGFNTCPAKKG